MALLAQAEWDARKRGREQEGEEPGALADLEQAESVLLELAGVFGSFAAGPNRLSRAAVNGRCASIEC